MVLLNVLEVLIVHDEVVLVHPLPTDSSARGADGYAVPCTGLIVHEGVINTGLPPGKYWCQTPRI